MNQVDFNNLALKILTRCKKLLKTKGHDYTQGGDDRLSNFKRVANKLSKKYGMVISPLLVLDVYAEKHEDAIETYMKKGKVESEPPEERFIDKINYTILKYALKQDLMKLEKGVKREFDCE